jgi:hypothetical protein
VYQAQESFHAVLDDGSERFVTKGEILPDRHELVRRDQDGTKTLFRMIDMGEGRLPEPEPPAKKDAPKDGGDGKTAAAPARRASAGSKS